MEVREGVQPNYTGTLDVAERERSRKNTGAQKSKW